jgi:hypothetical protein
LRSFIAKFEHLKKIAIIEVGILSCRKNYEGFRAYYGQGTISPSVLNTIISYVGKSEYLVDKGVGHNCRRPLSVAHETAETGPKNP